MLSLYAKLETIWINKDAQTAETETQFIDNCHLRDQIRKSPDTFIYFKRLDLLI